MFDLVADVRRYAEFLPWVVATRVKSDSETVMIADMLVGFSALREKFTSRVVKDRPRAIKVEYIEGPLKRLENDWTFTPLPDGGCAIDFCVDFTFRSAIFEKLAGQYLDAAFRKMVAAFEKRADQLYGNSSSSATSVA
jgi:coenzyme Q-binding protein COQ10